jgi:hypothetical protein
VPTLFQRSIADYARSVAEWRRARFDDPHRDPRNLRSAAGLEELAAFVLDLPEDDPHVATLRQHASSNDEFRPGQQVTWEIARFRFYHAFGSCDAFLRHLAELAERDATEHGRFGGRMAEGDDPWEEDEGPYHGGMTGREPR